MSTENIDWKGVEARVAKIEAAIVVKKLAAESRIRATAIANNRKILSDLIATSTARNRPRA